MILITLEPDPNIEPGHQWLALPYSIEGMELANVLAPMDDQLITSTDRGSEILIRHTHAVDQRIVELIDALAHVRFSAPGLVQMRMEEPVR